MKIAGKYKVGLTVLAVAVVTLVAGVLLNSQETVGDENIFQLVRPAFAEELSALGDIEDEAGIAAYFKASTSITLDDVTDAFRTIEAETSDYVIGSVQVDSYPETEDVHVYIHVDGWMLAYYLAADPSGKIFDWRAYHDGGRISISTKFENVLGVLAGEAGVVFVDPTYYDFRYPNATNLMLMLDWVTNGTDTYQVNLPNSFIYDERSWSHGQLDVGNRNATYWKLNGTTISTISIGGWFNDQGVLSPAQMLPDQFHEVTINHASSDYGFAGLALVYRVPS